MTAAVLDECPIYECPICLDSSETPCITPCMHIGCEECFVSVIISLSICPVCRVLTTVGQLVRLSLEDHHGGTPTAAGGRSGEEDDALTLFSKTMVGLVQA